jgi:hypothetical protein
MVRASGAYLRPPRDFPVRHVLKETNYLELLLEREAFCAAARHRVLALEPLLVFAPGLHLCSIPCAV